MPGGLNASNLDTLVSLDVRSQVRAKLPDPSAHLGRVAPNLSDVEAALLLIGLAAIVCGLMGTLVGISLSDVLSMAMPRFFDESIRLELLLYPWVMVLFLNGCHSLSQRLNI